ncbi:hypothetical protein [Treponema sp. R80B11-R83G3]
MKKIIFILLFLMSAFIYAREVPANNQGIANASPGDHIFRSNGEKVVLTQVDIDYARQKLGLTATQNSNGASTDSNSTGIIIVILLVVVGIIVVIGVCVSNIIKTVAKSSGMDEASAKKIGASAGVLAGTAAAIAAAVLLGKGGGIKRNPNDITITHKRG